MDTCQPNIFKTWGLWIFIVQKIRRFLPKQKVLKFRIKTWTSGYHVPRVDVLSGTFDLFDTCRFDRFGDYEGFITYREWSLPSANMHTQKCSKNFGNQLMLIKKFFANDRQWNLWNEIMLVDQIVTRQWYSETGYRTCFEKQTKYFLKQREFLRTKQTKRWKKLNKPLDLEKSA